MSSPNKNKNKNLDRWEGGQKDTFRDKFQGGTLCVDESQNNLLLYLFVPGPGSSKVSVGFISTTLDTSEIPWESLSVRTLTMRGTRGILEGAWSLRLDEPGIKSQGHYLTSCVILGNRSTFLSLCKCWEE